jgi:hypothetical protein
MRKQDRPAVANPIVEIDLAVGSVGCEVWRFGIYAQ